MEMTMFEVILREKIPNNSEPRWTRRSVRDRGIGASKIWWKSKNSGRTVVHKSKLNSGLFCYTTIALYLNHRHWVRLLVQLCTEDTCTLLNILFSNYTQHKGWLFPVFL